MQLRVWLILFDAAMADAIIERSSYQHTDEEIC